MKVTWTARARTRLAEIHDYIAQDSKPRALAGWRQLFLPTAVLIVSGHGISGHAALDAIRKPA
jgi:hypothetical protein